MNTYGIVAILLIIALIGVIVFARTEISPADYATLAALATADPKIIPQIRDAIREGKINKMSYFMIKSEQSGARQATNDKFSQIVGAKGEDQTAYTDQTKAIIALLLQKSRQ